MIRASVYPSALPLDGRSGRTVPHPRPLRTSAALPILATAWLCVAGVQLASGDEINLQTAAPHFSPTGTNQLFIHLLNDSPRQGLQLDLSYDPRVLQVISVAPLGRL